MQMSTRDHRRCWMFRVAARGTTMLATIAIVATAFACADGSAERSMLTAPDSASGALSLLPIQAPAMSMSVTVDPSKIVTGGTATAKATARDAFGDTITGRSPTWASSNTAVARVSSTGIVTAVAPGSASISAHMDFASGSATVTVLAPADSGATTSTAPVSTVTVTIASPRIEVGDTTTATATMRDSAGNRLSGHSVSWASADPNVATVSSSGLVTGGHVGSTYIVATSEGVVGQAPISITPPPSQVSIATQPPASVQSGTVMSPAPVVVLLDSTGARVTKGGVVIGVATARGTATLSGGLSAATDASGAATFSNLTLTGSDTSALRFFSTGLRSDTSNAIVVSGTAQSPPPSGSFATPNIVDNASFEDGWDGFVNTSLQPPPTGVTRDCTMASDGSCSVKRSWVPSSSDVGSQFLAKIGSQDHVWVRFYFKLTSPVSTIMKFARFYDSSIATNFGGLFLKSGNNIFSFGTDQENSAVVTTIGLTQAQVIDGNWHSLEFEYWRNGDPSGYPSAAFWFDGNQVSMPDGAVGMSMFWRGGRLYAGQRATSEKMSYMEWVGTLNGGNSTTGSVNLDKIAISSAGRIGP